MGTPIEPLKPSDLLNRPSAETIALKVRDACALWGKNPRALTLEPHELDVVLAAFTEAGVDVAAF